MLKIVKIVSQYFDGSPCCTFSPDKSACWKGVGHERFLLARRESEDLEKMKLDLVVLSALHSTRTSASTSHEVVRTSINYHFEGIKICKAAFLFVYAIGARRLKNLISQYDSNGLTVRMYGNTRKRPHNRTDSNEVDRIKRFIELFADNHGLPLPGRLPTHRD